MLTSTLLLRTAPLQFSFGSFRRSLTHYESALAYAFLGIIAGVLSGAAVIAFEHAIEHTALLWGVGSRGDNFESLPALERFALPLAGALTLGAAFSALQPEHRDVGIVHVISRLYLHYGMLPVRNAIVQFLGGVVALATGQSGGREGPGVHLGAAINSIIGQRLGLPNTSLRILIACGSAGGIAAAFNTPLAGVIFTMEVIVSEYTVAGFVPVVLSAVVASAMSHQLGGGAEIFEMSGVQLASLWEIPYVMLLGLCCGTASALLIRLSTLSAKLTDRPVLLRFALAGLLTGSLALLVPEVLGIGYDTLGRAMFQELALQTLLVIALAKIVATAVAVGFGMPVGLIGPTLLIGACIGGAAALVGAPLLASQQAMAFTIDPTLYVTVGMAATMGAVFGAPLAACLAAIELTQSTSVAMPALLAIIIANLVNTSLFRQRSAHRSVLRQLLRRLPDDPLDQLLHRTDVNAVIDSSVVTLDRKLGSSVVSTLAVQVPNWCLIQREGELLFLVSGNELMEWVENSPSEDEDPDITEATLRRWSIAVVPEQATLRQVLDILRARTVEAVAVYARAGQGKRILRGVVTRDRIERFALHSLNN